MANGQRPPPEGVEQVGTTGFTPGESLAAQIKQIAAQREARKSEQEARRLLMDANDAKQIGELEAKKILTDLRQKRLEKAEKDKQAAKSRAQSGGKPAPEPKDIMPPPANLTSKDLTPDMWTRVEELVAQYNLNE